MAKMLIFGGGIAGHMAARHLRKLSKEHEILVVNSRIVNQKKMKQKLSKSERWLMFHPFVQLFKYIYPSLKIAGIVAGAH